MILVKIEAEDSVFYHRIRYTMTQLLLPIGFPFFFEDNESGNEAIFSIACVPANRIESSISKNYKLAIPYWNHDQWTREDIGLRVKWFDDLPVLYAGEAPEFIIHERRLGFDLVNPAFYLLSRTEEYLYTHRDQRDRYAAPYSVLYENGILNIPLLNLYINFLESHIRKYIPESPAPKWKNNAPYAAMITHDVDHLPSYDVSIPIKHIRNFTKQKDIVHKIKYIKHFFRQIVSSITDAFPKWNLDYWLDFEDKLGFKSTFFFASNISNSCTVDPTYMLDSQFSYKGKRVKCCEIIREIEEKGWEIGLHGSYNTYRDGHLLIKEKTQLAERTGCRVYGIRQHYLRFDIRKTLKIQEKAGFNYDTTMGYNERNGFRAGIAFPFFPYNLEAEREYRLLELPMAVMDGNYFVEYGEKLDAEKAIRRCGRLLDFIEMTGGLIVVNFHPHYSDSAHADYLAVYEYLLKRFHESGAWVATGREVTDWWVARRKALDKTINY